MYTVIGFKRLDYVNRNNQRVLGYNVFCTCIDENVQGLKCREFYMNDSVGYVPELNQMIEVYYNDYQKVAKVIVIG